MDDTIEKPKHKPITEMMQDFEKFYVIRLFYKGKTKSLRSYFVGLGTKPRIVCCREISEAKMCSSEVADEWIITLNALNRELGYGKTMKVTKVLVDAQ